MKDTPPVKKKKGSAEGRNLGPEPRKIGNEKGDPITSREGELERRKGTKKREVTAAQQVRGEQGSATHLKGWGREKSLMLSSQKGGKSGEEMKREKRERYITVMGVQCKREFTQGACL